MHSFEYFIRKISTFGLNIVLVIVQSTSANSMLFNASLVFSGEASVIPSFMS